jgi:16S rRNA (guanine527-N7)-methyltransferase
MRIGSTEWRRIIQEGGAILGVPVSSEAVDRFAVYGRELRQWNRRMNLTAIADPVEMAIKHFLDSAAAAPYIPSDANKLLDIGAGAGFPGLVLKILRPDLDVALVDSVRKKVSFQQHMIRTLNLGGIRAVHVRAEAMAESGESRFDAVICRAVTELSRFFSMARPLLAPNGLCIAMKGRPEEVGAEIRECRSKHGPGVRWRTIPYSLPYLDARRTLAIHSASKSAME